MIIGFDKEKNEMYIRLGSSCLSQTLKTIGGFKAVWKDISPVYPFEGDFLDKHYESLYQSDIRFMIVILSFSIPAIILSCIGLFGVSLFVTEMRTKKVGIRRVNGATVGEIMTLLNKTYISKIIIAFLISCPFVYYLLSKWLQNFAYKTGLSWWVFGIAGITALVVATLSVSWQSWQAAKKDPVKTLKYE